MQLNLIALVKNGKFSFSENQRAKLNKMIQSKEGKVAQLTIGDIEKSRSGQQNKYYWGVVLELIADHTGAHENELHEYFIKEYSPKITVEVLGKVITRPKRTPEMTTVEFSEYIERIRVEASELQIVIPDPS